MLSLEVETYTYHLEDMLIWKTFEWAGWPEPITYLDIGANHPIRASNTYLFYKYGYRGVLVEPIPQNCDLLRKVRPEDVIIEGGVGWNDDTTAILKTRGGPYGITSYITAPLYKGWWHCIEIKLHKINDILANYFPESPPVFMSIDTEGHDLKILQTLNFDKYKIPIICAETDKRGTTEGFDEFMGSKGYFAKFKTQANTIYSSLSRRHSLSIEEYYNHFLSTKT